MDKGFTLLEILVVVGVMAVLISAVLGSGLDFYKTQQLNVHTQGIVQGLRRAQQKAMAVENDSNFGVHFANNNYTLFKGSNFEQRDIQYDEVVDLPQVLTVSGIQEIVFSKVEGIPSLVGDIIISNGIETRIIDINEIGRINLE